MKFSDFFKTIYENRPLTDEEIVLAKSVFGDGIDYCKVQLIKHPVVWKNYAISPNGKIYFHKDGFYPNYAKESLRIRAWFIHEMAHVWQYQHGENVVGKALLDRKYDYTLGRAFSSYGIEQQAQIIQDYYTRKELGLDCSEYVACIPFLIS